MSNLETLKADATKVLEIKISGKSGREDLKSLGSKIADAARRAIVENDETILQWIDSHRGNRSEKTKPSALMEANKQYFTRGLTVGQAILDGLFTESEVLNDTTVTLYDKYLAKKKKEAESASELEAIQLKKNAAFLAVLGNQNEVNKFLLENAADPMTIASVEVQGLAMLAEQEAENSRKEREQAAVNDLTVLKSHIDIYRQEFPDLFAELQDYVNGVKVAKAA